MRYRCSWLHSAKTIGHCSRIEAELEPCLLPGYVLCSPVTSRLPACKHSASPGRLSGLNAHMATGLSCGCFPVFMRAITQNPRNTAILLNHGPRHGYCSQPLLCGRPFLTPKPWVGDTGATSWRHPDQPLDAFLTPATTEVGCPHRNQNDLVLRTATPRRNRWQHQGTHRWTTVQ